MNNRRGKASCFECAKIANHFHHVVPKILGGTRTIPLCAICHGKVHGVKLTNNSKLIKLGQEKARKEGRIPGRKQTYDDFDYKKAIELRKQGFTFKQISKITGISDSRIYQICKKNKIETIISTPKSNLIRNQEIEKVLYGKV